MSVWTAILMVENMPTTDGRYVERVEWEERLYPLMSGLTDDGHHDTLIVGRIGDVRREAPYIVGEVELGPGIGPEVESGRAKLRAADLEERLRRYAAGDGPPVEIGADLDIRETDVIAAPDDDGGLWLARATLLGATVLPEGAHAAHPQCRFVCEWSRADA